LSAGFEVVHFDRDDTIDGLKSWNGRGSMSNGDKVPTNPKAADFKIHARLEAGESLESIIANPPTTISERLLEGNIISEWQKWRTSLKRGREKSIDLSLT
jgi:hypothetical protein